MKLVVQQVGNGWVAINYWGTSLEYSHTQVFTSSSELFAWIRYETLKFGDNGEPYPSKKAPGNEGGA